MIKGAVSAAISRCREDGGAYIFTGPPDSVLQSKALRHARCRRRGQRTARSMGIEGLHCWRDQTNRIILIDKYKDDQLVKAIRIDEIKQASLYII